MTGTSLDALDVALVEADGSGLGMSCRVVETGSEDLGGLSARLRALAEGRAHTAGEIARLALDFAEFHVGVIRGVVGSRAVSVIAVHGQTVFHAPPLSWQLMNPWPIARAFGCPVVSDLRGADLAAGGQGAPITPLADWVLLRSSTEARAVVNLGGFCNITLLPLAEESGSNPDAVRGMDVCACNHVLDRAARAAMGIAFDAGGENASRGTVHAGAADELAAVLGGQSRAGRSLGTGDESGAWIDGWVKRVRPSDLLASAVDGLGRVVAAAAKSADRLLVAGGGAHNAALLNAIARHAGKPVETTERHGLPVSHREAAEMAVLGLLSMDGVAITLPAVTGVGSPVPISGSWSNVVPAVAMGGAR